MHQIANKKSKIFVCIFLVIFGFSLNAAGQDMIPIQGMPVPELAEFDKIMSGFMKDNNIEAGLLGIMLNGVIVYQRGFGWKDAGHNELLRHDALMRIASVTKPFTAAATQRLVAGPLLDSKDFAFDLGQEGGGILNYPAFPTLGDPEFALITIQHLYNHCGGWDRDIQDDYTYEEIQIAKDFNLTTYPPGRIRTVRWIMGRELPHTPGSQRVYSNVGFLVLGLIVEQVSGNDLIGYVRKNVLGPLDWVPVTELVQGRTFPAQRDPREPWYDCHKSAVNVFNPFYPPDPVYYYELPNYVIESDGGWDHEARIGQGGIVSSTSMMLHLAENYYIEEKGCSNNSYGLPTGGKRQDRFHTGAFCGTNAVLQQRKDGINFAVIFNKDGKDVKTTLTYYEAIRIRINDTIKNVNINWPTQGIDGQWADFTKATAGEGSFEDPWNDLSLAIKGIADEGTLNIKPGKKRWTGTIKKKMRIRAPLGTATIGKAP